MLLDLAVLPEVFDESAYSAPGLCGHFLKVLMPVLFEDAVVRDLRNGGWSQWMRKSAGKCHHTTAEIVETLAKQQRLGLFPPVLEVEPEESSEWCYEALATHEKAALNAIICGNGVAADFENDKLVQPLEKVHESDWYNNRGRSVRLHRQSADYLKTLLVPMRWCNSAMFIDPHLDPSRPGYKEFYQLLEMARNRQVKPQIEMHRCLPFVGNGPDRRPLSRGEIETLFAPLSTILDGAGLKAEVFIWDTMHDRYLITNQIGIALLNGFDISQDVNEVTTWTRLSAKDREDIQREFDPSCNRHQLRWCFDIGKTDVE
jgi:hypothetical protein